MQQPTLRDRLRAVESPQAVCDESEPVRSNPYSERWAELIERGASDPYTGRYAEARDLLADARREHGLSQEAAWRNDRVNERARWIAMRMAIDESEHVYNTGKRLSGRERALAQKQAELTWDQAHPDKSIAGLRAGRLKLYKGTG